MGSFGEYRRDKINSKTSAAALVANPTVPCEIQEPVERMLALTTLVDSRAHNFLANVIGDEMFVDIVDADKEWRCWLEGDTEGSRLFFDEKLEAFGDEPYDHFLRYYSEEWKAISDELAAIHKLGSSLDEYRIFKTSLYNVFNNKYQLPTREYFDQVFTRAKDYNMTLERRSREDLDFIVSFQPLREVNRGNSYLNYTIRMEFNPNYAKEGHVYSAKLLDAVSSRASFSGPVDLPIYGHYSKFEALANEHFFGDRNSLFYYDALKAQRVAEKKKYNIPADYFEGTFVDTTKLVASGKSYRYGDSKIYIPKSQVAFAGENNEKLYMKRWLFYKLKEPIEKINMQTPKKGEASLDARLADATERSEATQGEAGNREAVKEDLRI